MSEQSIDLIIINGEIATINPKQPAAEAIAVNNGKIIAVGTTKEIQEKYPICKKRLDLEGNFLCPGFIDAHTHLLQTAVRSFDIQFHDTKSYDEALEKIRQKLKTTSKGNWVFGSGWDETEWDKQKMFTLQDLDDIAPHNPCYLRRVCGHLAAVNTLALKELNISLDDPDLEKDEKGNPTGIITDALIDRLADNPKLKRSQAEIDAAVVKACEMANALGITSVTDNLTLPNLIAYQKAWKNDELTVRVYMNIPRKVFSEYLATGLKSGFGNELLKLGGIKIFTDGSIGARTAALSDPYEDDPSTNGGFYIEKKQFEDIIDQAIRNDWQTATHAIGDRAIEFILETFEQHPHKKKISSGRHRIEHAEYLRDDQLKRAQKLGLILSMQPNFPGRWGKPGQLYEIRLGKNRYKQLNNFRKIMDTDIHVCFGSDNMPMDPLFGIWSVVTHPLSEIRITPEEALYHYTLGSAYASYEEDIKGSIEIGKVADFVVLDKNPLKNLEAIKEIVVLMTLHNGEIVYQLPEKTNELDNMVTNYLDANSS